VRIGDIDPHLASRPKLDTSTSIRAHSLVDRNLEDLSAADLAFCLRQGIAIPPVAARALKLLWVQPLLEAEHYSGDLLSAAIHAESNDWLESAQADELRDVCISVVTRISCLLEDVIPLAEDLIRRRNAT
jgi:hypothetical protein